MRRKRHRWSHRQRVATFWVGSILNFHGAPHVRVNSLYMCFAPCPLRDCKKYFFVQQQRYYPKTSINNQKISTLYWYFLVDIMHDIYQKNIDIISNISILYQYFLVDIMHDIYQKNIDIISDISILYRYFLVDIMHDI